MKKVLVVLLVLFVGAGLFAQEITPYGSLRLDFGGKLENNGTDNTGSYVFDAGGAGTGLGLNFEGDNFHGNVQWSPGDYGAGITGNGTVTLADLLDLTIGLDHLPTAFWSPLAIFGDSNYSIGATSIGKVPYFKLGAFGAYLGVGAPALLKMYGQTPVFFAGYDFTPESNAFTFGLAVAFQSTSGATSRSVPNPSFDPTSPDPDDWALMIDVIDTSGKAGLPLLATLHGRFSVSESIHILGNVGLHLNPGAFGGINPVYGLGAAGDKTIGLEGFIGANIGITDSFGLDFTFAGVGDLAKKEDGGGLSLIKVGLDAQVKLSDNFALIPGVIFTKPLKLPYDIVKAEGFQLDYGVSLKYSF